LNGVDPQVSARDMLDPSKSEQRLAKLRSFAPDLSGRILEIGSGFGINLVVWTHEHGLDVTGVEPQGDGFSDTLDVSRQICSANQVDPARIVEAKGEELPFPDASFDVVYSAYVLEHTQDPKRVLSEALRVLKPGGLLHFELPNHLAPFEGHYMAITPPVVWKPILPWYVRNVLKRDPAFAEATRTEINPFWLRRSMRELARTHPHSIVSLGEEFFIERLRNLTFESEAARATLGALWNVARFFNRGDLISKAMVMAGTYYPIFLTARKAG